MRRPGRRPGFRGIGGGGAAAAFTPASDPLVNLWWDPTTPAAGAVSSWVDRIASVDATQATGSKQPSKSSTAISGAYPGVTGDGGDVLVASGAGAVLSGKTVLTVTCAMVDTDTATRICLELTADVSANDGGMFVAANNNSLNRLSHGLRSTVGYSSVYAAGQTLASVVVCSFGMDYTITGAGACVWLRVNGISQALNTLTSASVAGGGAANAPIYLFGRGATPTLGWAGTFGDVVIRNSAAQDTGLTLIEQYIAARVGLSF